jgi:hypothetical protein
VFPCILFSPISDAQDKLRVGLSSVSATSGRRSYEEKVLFKKHGIDAEVIIIGGGHHGCQFFDRREIQFQWAAETLSSVIVRVLTQW